MTDRDECRNKIRRGKRRCATSCVSTILMLHQRGQDVAGTSNFGTFYLFRSVPPEQFKTSLMESYCLPRRMAIVYRSVSSTVAAIRFTSSIVTAWIFSGARKVSS